MKSHPHNEPCFCRNCIGQIFALNEERVVIGNILIKYMIQCVMALKLLCLLNRFSIHLDEDHVVEMVPEVILRAKYGIKLKLELLQN